MRHVFQMIYFSKISQLVGTISETCFGRFLSFKKKKSKADGLGGENRSRKNIRIILTTEQP